MEDLKNITYDVKCRRCSKISRIVFGENTSDNIHNFRVLVVRKANEPLEKECSCNRGMILFHDIIGYNKLF